MPELEKEWKEDVKKPKIPHAEKDPAGTVYHSSAEKIVVPKVVIKKDPPGTVYHVSK